MPEPYKKTLVEQLEAELQSVLRERPATNIVWASDGAEPQWQALEGIERRLPAECGLGSARRPPPPLAKDLRTSIDYIAHQHGLEE